ncbi:preprotein translocase subunit SecY [Bifidobacterium ruminantium]|uniref:Protein translocase subunit SecY n=1 Tax=Bifidobacterium ruminantium TaxID=78346 RepID=A0A087CWE3_BIFRU|nr:preprotein translocase subunit SecY [Bifidobacterium ruminantium]KFI87593.1 preprotein translocase, SecY subunit [Bifidobacterium ruminantium]MBM6746176.1 preprotein translocase subunit SecY [Bifidobacterium ruminantium]MBU9111674.1 preprotein translocase subunit SecY [Bifidobacterium ruminantium]MEE0971875.1 preprotein translocase subunit SecY [Bifidobacterium ruminantium]
MRTLIQALKTKELRNKILFTLGIIIIYRIGSFIPTPGVDYTVVHQCVGKMNSTSENFIGLVNLFSGGAMLQLSIFALGVMPYITASIVIQLLRVVIPRFEMLHKEGQSGEAKLTQYTRYLTIGLAVLQSTTILVTARSGALFNYQCSQVVPDGSVWNLIVMVLIMTGGTGLIMWMAELITDKGLGQGMSILIFMSICSGFLPQLWEIGWGTNGTDGNWGKFAAVVGVLLVIMILVIYVELSQRRIPVQYTRRMIGRKMYGGSSTYLPLKINMSGVIPPIFASSILAVPTLIAQFGNSDQSWVKWINSNLANTTSVWYIVLYALMIVFFCFFYTEITFNPDETADNMKQYGGFIPGIRAGSATSNYLSYVMNRLNTVGAVYLLFVALIPTVLIMALNLNTKLPFGGTTILIIAGVGLDTLRQAKAQTEQFQYAGFLFEDTDHKEGK